MFGKRLKKLRKDKKMTQEELGKLVNVTKVSISGYENGNRMPDTETLTKLADVFCTNVDYLLGRSDDPRLTEIEQKEVDGEFKEIKKMVDDLSEEDKKRVLQRLLDFTRGAIDRNK